MPVPMYDSLSSDYDRFVNWSSRLSFEMPFIETQLASLAAGSRPLRVLDAACGTGMHAIELARRGHLAAGADYSPGMIERARQNAHEAGQVIDFQIAGFGELARKFNGFDALLCLGNSLPHVAGLAELTRTLEDFALVLRPDGLLLLQNRNFDLVLNRQERWMAPESAQQDDRECLFVRFYDFDPDGLITFNILTLTRQNGLPWQQKVDSTRLYPLRRSELLQSLKQAGFRRFTCYGNMSGEPFELHVSENLVINAICRDQ
jgi:glycine/sarcosine N-methyltransferase